jgi:hypothetical protein
VLAHCVMQVLALRDAGACALRDAGVAHCVMQVRTA